MNLMFRQKKCYSLLLTKDDLWQWQKKTQVRDYEHPLNHGVPCSLCVSLFYFIALPFVNHILQQIDETKASIHFCQRWIFFFILFSLWNQLIIHSKRQHFFLFFATLVFLSFQLVWWSHHFSLCERGFVCC